MRRRVALRVHRIEGDFVELRPPPASAQPVGQRLEVARIERGEPGIVHRRGQPSYGEPLYRNQFERHRIDYAHGAQMHQRCIEQRIVRDGRAGDLHRRVGPPLWQLRRQRRHAVVPEHRGAGALQPHMAARPCDDMHATDHVLQSAEVQPGPMARRAEPARHARPQMCPAGRNRQAAWLGPGDHFAQPRPPADQRQVRMFHAWRAHRFGQFGAPGKTFGHDLRDRRPDQRRIAPSAARDAAGEIARHGL